MSAELVVSLVSSASFQMHHYLPILVKLMDKFPSTLD